MYNKRIKVFLGLAGGMLILCLVRLILMQLQPRGVLDERIETLKDYKAKSEQLNTIRGRILDRNGHELARDEARFKLLVSYWDLTKYMDPNLQTILRNRARDKEDPKALTKVEQALANALAQIQQVIKRSASFGLSHSEAKASLEGINTFVWRRRLSHAWRQHCKDSPLYQENRGHLGSIPYSKIEEDMIRCFPDADRRRELIGRADVLEMHQSYPLLELPAENVVFAQMEFSDINGVSIEPTAERVYPYGSVAAQLIGWTGPAGADRLTKLFADDPLARYLDGEICGREDGVEYVCEAVLRGRRGQITKDIDKHVVRKIDTHYGQDVTLTLDIQLQRDMENYLRDYPRQDYWKAGMAAVVIDVSSADILAMVSLPTYDLNQARYHYKELLGDGDVDKSPLFNRALNVHYKPGSMAKPVTLVAGLEGHHITPDEPISCPDHAAPRGWPNCWIWREYHIGHDSKWINTARNALRGSCNIYFSHLAYDRLDPRELQKWLFAFGYGHQVPFQYPPLPATVDPNQARQLHQAPGLIASLPPKYGQWITSLDQIGVLNRVDTRLVGMGEGNFNATVLQAANCMATFARKGIHINPRLFILPAPQGPDQTVSGTKDLNLSPETLATVYDGLHAVVNEPGGTAYDAFRHSGFAELGVEVWGKTGSTEDPENAWFGGFARDRQGRQIALAFIVEGGRSGSKEAAPLARGLIQCCIDHGYLGSSPNH